MKTLCVKFEAALGHTVRTMVDPYGTGNVNNLRVYDYLYDGDRDVNTGDLAVVQVTAKSGGGFKLVRVIEVIDGATDKATKHVIDIVDMSAHRAREAKRIRTAAIEKELAERVKVIDNQMRYQLLAQIDPVSAKLLAELRELG